MGDGEPVIETGEDRHNRPPYSVDPDVFGLIPDALARMPSQAGLFGRVTTADEARAVAELLHWESRTGAQVTVKGEDGPDGEDGRVGG